MGEWKGDEGGVSEGLGSGVGVGRKRGLGWSWMC